MFERPENWQNKLKPQADGPVFPIATMATNTLCTALPRLIQAIVPAEHVLPGAIPYKVPPYNNPDKFWLRVAYEQIHRELDKSKHQKELARGCYKKDWKMRADCWQTYMDCPHDLLPKDS